MNNQTNQQGDSTVFLFFAGLVFIFIVIPAIYAAKAETCNSFLIAIAKIELRPFLGFSDEARIAWNHINTLDPAQMSWNDIQPVLNYAGKWARWPLLLLMIGMAAFAFFVGKIGNLMRKFNMESLLRNNAESFACLAPIVGKGKYLLSRKSLNFGPWKVACTPVQFAVENNLLIDSTGNTYEIEDVLHNGIAHEDKKAFANSALDIIKAKNVFVQQLGEKFVSVENLSSLRKALAASFASYASGNKKEAINILDKLSRSYTDKGNKNEEIGIPRCPILEDINFKKLVLTTLDKNKDIFKEHKLKIHTSYELTWFMALLERARKKGVLATSQFIFLRPLDRSLWYTLNQCGGRAAWVEAIAPWAHYSIEEKFKKSINDSILSVESSVKSLERSLFDQGWLLEQKDTSNNIIPDECTNDDIEIPTIDIVEAEFEEF